MSIQLVTYANQTVTPTNDAIIYERAIDQNGIFYGCNVTVTGNNVNITGGYGIICGREFTINSESIAVTLAPSGTLLGRLYVRLDLADADAPIQLLTVTGNSLPALEQDSNVNFTNGTYEMELATFNVGVSALSDVVETFETIVGTTYQTKRLSPTVTASTGSVVSCYGRKVGNVIFIAIGVKNSNNVQAGSNVFYGTLESAFRPGILTNGVGYVGSNILVAQITNTGAMTVRVGAGEITADTTVYVTFTYII